MNSPIIIGTGFFGAALIVFFVPNWRGIRAGVFFLMWQMVTPVREWYIDMPLFIFAVLLVEATFERIGRMVR